MNKSPTPEASAAAKAMNAARWTGKSYKYKRDNYERLIRAQGKEPAKKKKEANNS